MWNWSRYPVTSILENNLQSKEMNALHCTDFNRTSYLITSAVLVSTKFSGEKMGQLFIQRTTSKMQQTSIYDINPPTSLRVNIEVRGDPGEAGTLVHSHRPQSDLAHQCWCCQCSVRSLLRWPVKTHAFQTRFLGMSNLPLWLDCWILSGFGVEDSGWIRGGGSGEC